MRLFQLIVLTFNVRFQFIPTQITQFETHRTVPATVDLNDCAMRATLFTDKCWFHCCAPETTRSVISSRAISRTFCSVISVSLSLL